MSLGSSIVESVTLEPLADRIAVPIDCMSSVYFVDESGSKGSGGDHFVVAAVKTNDPDALTRGMEAIRARHGIRRELKFRELTKGTIPIFKELVDLLESSGSNIGAFVIDKTTFDPFDGKALWEAHAWVTAALIKGMTSRRELATVLIDGISTPADIAYGSHLRNQINQRFNTMRVVSAISLDSRTCDGLQLADMVASAIAHRRRIGAPPAGESRSPKAEIAHYLALRYGLADFDDVRAGRVTIRTGVDTTTRPIIASVQLPVPYSG